MLYLNILKEYVLKEDIYNTELILRKISNTPNPFEYVEKILEIMECNPYLDYGVPGPLVHFMEKYYGEEYRDLVFQSVQKKPTSQTVWLINRILNDRQIINRQKYLSLFEQLLKREDVENQLKNEIQSFIDYQNS